MRPPDPSHVLGPWADRGEPTYPAPERQTCTVCGAYQQRGPGLLDREERLAEPCRPTTGKPPVDPVSVFWSPAGWGAEPRLLQFRPGTGAYVSEVGDGYGELGSGARTTTRRGPGGHTPD